MKVNEIFISIDGEVNKWGQGAITTFIRLSGCNLSCSYCDTDHQNSREMTITEIMAAVPTPKVTITGGEPLLQSDIFFLIQALWKKGHIVSIETNGTKYIPFEFFRDDSINWIIDYKFDSPPVHELDKIPDSHFLKFVISSKEEFDEALKIKRRIVGKTGVIKIAFSAAIPTLSPQMLLAWLIAEKEWDIILNVQIHKLIGVR